MGACQPRQKRQTRQMRQHRYLEVSSICEAAAVVVVQSIKGISWEGEGVFWPGGCGSSKYHVVVWLRLWLWSIPSRAYLGRGRGRGYSG